MEFFTSILTNLVLPVIIISASFGLVFVYGFKSQPSQPDFKGFSFIEEEEKPKSKKLKPKKSSKKPVQSFVQKITKKPEIVATETKVTEVSQKTKKEMIKAEKAEAQMNKEEWTVKINKKSKKKQEKVDIDKKDNTKKNESEENGNKIDLKTFLEHHKIKLPNNVLIPDNTLSESDGNKLTKPDKNIKKNVPKSSKLKDKTLKNEEVVEKEVKNEEGKDVTKEDLKKEENKGVKLVVEDGSGDVARAEKQIIEVKDDTDKKKKKKNQKVKDVAIPIKEQAVIQNVNKTEVKVEPIEVVPSENGASKKKKKKNKDTKSENEVKTPIVKKEEVTKIQPTSQVISSAIKATTEAPSAPTSQTTGKKTLSEPLTNGGVAESNEDWTEAKPIKKKKKILKAL